MLITPQYQAQCAALHVADPGWGDGAAHRDVKRLVQYADDLKTKDVLDYGCGKGMMAKMWPWPINEYDPAILGKQQRPAPADFVMCLDVMEHIEPDCLMDVLADLYRVTKKICYMTIALTPAKKHLPDGRNAHLIVEPWEWWKNKLEHFFYIHGSHVATNESGKSEVHVLVSRLPLGPAPQAQPPRGPTPQQISFDGTEVPFADKDRVINLLDYEMVEFGDYMPVAFFPENLANSVATFPPERWYRKPEAPEIKEQRIAVVGYGPSLRESVQYITPENYDVIVSMSGSYNYLMERGIRPTHHFDIDWKPHKSKFTAKAEPGTKYFISSICNPATVDNVKNLDSQIMFIEHGDQITYPEGAYVRTSGYDVGQHALIVMKELGYRNFDLFGFDYCFDVNKIRHAGEHGGRVHHYFKGRVGDKVFYTSKTMFAALLVFEFWLKDQQDCTFSFASDTLLPNFLQGRMELCQPTQSSKPTPAQPPAETPSSDPAKSGESPLLEAPVAKLA